MAKKKIEKSTKIAIITAGALVVCAVIAGIIILALRATITDVSLPTELEISKGETAVLEPQYEVSGNSSEKAVSRAAEKIQMQWESSNDEVVSVDSSGSVTGLSAGDAYITLYATVNGSTDTSICHVTVKVDATGITAPETLELIINYSETKQLGAMLIPADATGITLTYSSSDETIATIDSSGNVTAVSAGTCTVTVSASTDTELVGEASTEVTVLTAPSSIEVNDMTIEVGTTASLSIITSPTVCTAGTNYEYTSSTTSVCTVDSSGNVTGVSPGVSTIIVTNEYGKTAYCIVTVQQPQYTDFDLGETSEDTN
ncbi:MAG: Ig-like domain-containing protein [Oscillospiraceae bacterium]|jgi:uncharacterized protein YjdB